MQFFEYMCTVESGTLAFIKDNKITNYQECGPDMVWALLYSFFIWIHTVHLFRK